MARDLLLRLSGNSASPIETVTATGALGGGGGVYVGADKTVHFRQLIGSVSGTNPTLDTKIQHSANGVAWSDTGLAFAQATDDQLGADLSESAAPILSFRTQSGYPYVRAYATIGGTATPTFTVEVRMDADLAAVA